MDIGIDDERRNREIWNREIRRVLKKQYRGEGIIANLWACRRPSQLQRYVYALRGSRTHTLTIDLKTLRLSTIHMILEYISFSPDLKQIRLIVHRDQCESNDQLSMFTKIVHTLVMMPSVSSRITSLTLTSNFSIYIEGNTNDWRHQYYPMLQFLLSAGSQNIETLNVFPDVARLSGHSTTSFAARSLSEGIRSNRSLTRLHVNENGAPLTEIIEALKSHPCLEEIVLGGSYDRDDPKYNQISELLQHCRTINKLLVEGVHFFRSVRKRHFQRILDASSCSSQLPIACSIGEAVNSDAGCGRNSFRLLFGTTSHPSPSLQEAARISLPFYVVPVILQNSSVQELHLSKVQIRTTRDSTTTLLRNSRSLKKLKVTDIKAPGFVSALARGLEGNSSLTSLQLDQREIESGEILQILSSLCSDCSLQELFIDTPQGKWYFDNEIIFTALLGLFETATKLRKLSLRFRGGCWVIPTELELIAGRMISKETQQAIEHNDVLTDLTLEGW